MTKEEIEKSIELLEAIKNGKELYNIYRNSKLNLNSDRLIYLSLESIMSYHITPEPRYVPYTWEDWKDFMGREVNMGKFQNNNTIGDFKAVGLTSKRVGLLCPFAKDDFEMFWCSFEEAFEKVTYPDGTPFGKLVEE